MTRAACLFAVFLLFSFISTGQCVDPPTVTLNGSSGNTCGTTPVTISNNLFGGTATIVTITSNGKGTISPPTTSKTPFDFTYTPSTGDIGNVITITATTNIPRDMQCPAAIDSYILTVAAYPSAPLVGFITQPTCASSTGSVALSGLPSTGSWTLNRSPGGTTTTGTGPFTVISDLVMGNYTFTVSNSKGCVSTTSAIVIINTQPVVPTAPAIGTITQPSVELPTGSLVLNGLPATGSWTLTLLPGNLTTLGSGTSKTISGLSPGSYSFTVTNSSGCTSAASASFVINTPIGPPIVVITNPAPVCAPSTVDLTVPAITAGSALSLTYSYWTDPIATFRYSTPAAATDGTYYIKATTTDGFFTIKPVIVNVYQIPVADAGPDQILSYMAGATMSAQLTHTYETGHWSIVSGTGEFSDSNYFTTTATGLSVGRNIFLWTVTNGICPASSDSITIDVRDQFARTAPTLITPNMDGKNDYLILKTSESLSRMDLIIFDRRGVQVYKNNNYHNTWNGVDSNGNQLADDTYFYVYEIEKGISASGFIVVRR